MARWGNVLGLGGLAFGSTLIVWRVAGDSLNLLLVGLVVVSVLTPPFAVGCRRGWELAATVVSGTMGVAVVWLAARHGTWLSVEQVGVCWLIAGAVVGCAAAIGRGMVVCRAEPTIAAAGVSAFVLAWLLWPMWCQTAPPLPVKVHPLLAVNGVVAEDLGIWTEQPVAYPWIMLGQDVSYRLPISPWPCIALHGGLALCAVFASFIATRQQGGAHRRSIVSLT